MDEINQLCNFIVTHTANKTEVCFISSPLDIKMYRKSNVEYGNLESEAVCPFQIGEVLNTTQEAVTPSI